MKKSFFAALLCILYITACKQTEKANTDTVITAKAKARIDSTLKSFVDSSYVAGISALVFEKDKEVYFNAFGYADREAQTKMDRNTIVRIYSMTKPVTGVALMTLYDQGKFQLDDPLTKYAPEFASLQVLSKVNESGIMVTEPLNRPVTIRDITRHTAGFVNNGSVPAVGPMFADAVRRENTLQQLGEKFGRIPLMFQPGEQWSYGPSVDIQAFLVEKISKKPFDQYVKETILDPLKMNTTSYVVSENNKKNFAAMYSMGEDKTLTRVPAEQADYFNTQDWPLKPGGWGLTSTLDDYMRFAQMLVNEGTLDGVTILKPETVQLMATNHLSDSVTERMWLPSKGQVGFGIDFAVRIAPPASADENQGAVGEFFWDGAASTLFWVDPKNDLTAVLFVQKFPFYNRLHKAFRDAVYGKWEPGTLN